MLSTETVMKKCPVIPVVTLDDPAQAVPLANALSAGGLSVIEVTLRTDAGLPGIAEIAKSLPDIVVGAGTVLTPDQGDAAIAAGSKFLVSPGTTDALITYFKTCDAAVLPGAATSSEVMRLMEAGFHHLKFFPAEAAGGVSMLKSWSAPLADAAFCPTGGVNPANAKSYLSLKNVLCVGGSWMVPADLMASNDWAAIERLAGEATAALG